MTNLEALHRLEAMWADAGEDRVWFKLSKMREIAVKFAMELDEREKDLLPEGTGVLPTSAYKDLNGDIFIVMLDGGVHQWRKGDGWQKVGSLPSRAPQTRNPE